MVFFYRSKSRTSALTLADLAMYQNLLSLQLPSPIRYIRTLPAS